MKILRYKNGFCLLGEVVDENKAGVWFKTRTETSFINYDDIKSIRVHEDE